MSDRYQPELGQAAFGCPWGAYETGELGDACIAYVCREISRVYWNINQEEWDGRSDPEIAGLTWRPYWWGDEEDPEATKPNLEHGDVAIRWYKYPGRGQSVSKQMSADDWKSWLEGTLATVRAHENGVHD